MAGPGSILQQRFSALLEIDARIPGGIPGLTAAHDDDVIDLIESAQLAMQSLQAVLVAGAGELARRSTGTGDRSLARRLGWKSASGVLAAKAGISFGEASRLVAVGEAIRPNIADSGEDLPADRPHIAAAMAAGDLTVQIAQLIDQTLDKLTTRLERDLLDDLERTLVAEWRSGRFSVAAFTAHCHEVVEQHDAASAKQRDDALRRQASIRETWLHNGMLRIVAELDPEAAAFYLTAIRARTNPRRPGNVTDLGAHRAARQPTPMEAKVHAFITIMRDAIRAEHGPQAGIDTTILVRIDLDALLTGIGAATIDGIPKPISASAARRLACEANLIPQVLGGHSQLLDQGESKREFTKAQRYAILANHDRCTFPGCDIPPSMLEFHHIDRWASRHLHEEATDLHNGLPLCGFHNRLMEDGWDVSLDDRGIPWFIPPATLDPRRTPLRGSSLTDRRAA
jgi:Domain of unknown function (DUF222)